MSLNLVEFPQDTRGLVHDEPDTFTCGGSSCNVLAVPGLLCVHVVRCLARPCLQHAEVKTILRLDYLVRRLR